MGGEDTDNIAKRLRSLRSRDRTGGEDIGHTDDSASPIASVIPVLLQMSAKRMVRSASIRLRGGSGRQEILLIHNSKDRTIPAMPRGTKSGEGDLIAGAR